LRARVVATACREDPSRSWPIGRTPSQRRPSTRGRPLADPHPSSGWATRFTLKDSETDTISGRWTPKPTRSRRPADPGRLLPLDPTLRASLPPPTTDFSDGVARRDNAAVGRVASLLPVSAAEANLACQCVTANAQAMHCLRQALDPAAAPDFAPGGAAEDRLGQRGRRPSHLDRGLRHWVHDAGWGATIAPPSPSRLNRRRSQRKQRTRHAMRSRQPRIMPASIRSALRRSANSPAGRMRRAQVSVARRPRALGCAFQQRAALSRCRVTLLAVVYLHHCQERQRTAGDR